MSTLEPSRRTPDGVLVMQGGFAWVDTFGVPLDVLVEQLRDHGMMLDWLDFWVSAELAGWKPDRTMLRLRAAVVDVYGSEWADAWQGRMDAWLSLRAGGAA